MTTNNIPMYPTLSIVVTSKKETSVEKRRNRYRNFCIGFRVLYVLVLFSSVACLIHANTIFNQPAIHTIIGLKILIAGIILIMTAAKYIFFSQPGWNKK